MAEYEELVGACLDYEMYQCKGIKSLIWLYLVYPAPSLNILELLMIPNFSDLFRNSYFIKKGGKTSKQND